MNYTALVADDDVKLAKLLKAYFDREGFTTYLAHDGLDALQMVKDKQPDILILELMLPRMDGWEICRRIGEERGAPAILMLTARDRDTDRITSFELGADDFVPKPFSPREVVARAKAILGCARNTATAQAEPIEVADLVIDIKECAVRKGDKVIGLTPTEIRLLEIMATDVNRTFTRLQIAERIQGDACAGYERTTDSHIKNIRHKIEDDPKDPRYIKTVYGIGYKFCG